MRSLAVFASALAIAGAMNVGLEAQQRWPGPGDKGAGGDQSTGRTAVPRNDPPPQPAAPAPAPTPPAPAPAPARTASAPAPAAAASPGVEQRRAEPRPSHPRGDNPQVGTAVPRPPNRPPRPGGPDYDYDPPSYAYYYPRLYYPYGYGSFGLGYFYYDPYSWYPGYWGGSFSGYGYGYPTGEIRLKVKPRDAEVFVDGYYAGTVNDFDGFAQGLRLEEGPYTIEIRAPGYAPLSVNVRIQPGRKITYDGDLRREP